MSTTKIAIFLIFAIYFWIPQNGASPVEAKGEEQAGADTLMSEREYYSRLKAADEKTFKQDFETYFVFLLESEQKKAYGGLQSLDEKKVYIQSYWMATNPNPLFPENDWLLEFNRRVQYGKKHFRRASPPYVDDRGRYYIKYGEPDRRFVDIGGHVTHDDNFRIRYSTFPNETWSYENIQSNFVVYFVRDGVSYRQVYSLIEALLDKGSMNQNMEYFFLHDMIEKRQHISAALARATLRGGVEELLFFNEAALYKAPSTARDALQAENNLNFFDRVAQFRGSAGKTRIDVALLVPLKKNLIKKGKESFEDTLNVEFAGMLRDENFEPVTWNQDLSSLAVKLAAGATLPNAVGEFSLLARPQDAEVTLQVQEKQRKKMGYSRRPFPIRDFSSTTELMVSDIQLNYRVRNDVQKKILPTSRQRDFLVSPYPFQKVRKDKPPLVYFEIYNVQSSGVGERIQISYTINSIKGNKGAVNVTFDRPVVGENMDELVEINLKNVKKGWNNLKVVVSSLQDSTIQAVAQKKISVKK